MEPRFVIRNQSALCPVSKTFRLPQQTHQRLEKALVGRDLSYNRLVVQCIEFALDHLEDAAKDATINDEISGYR